MSRQSRTQPAASSGGAMRQNEYFVPRDGIDREVISADICRYLGNDALVRPGVYENPQTGQVAQGYFITAYRNLTTAMIEDLKADSARWDSERRAQTSRNTSGGSQASRNAMGVPRHSSNSPVGAYRYSETHQSRQHLGPSDAASSYGADPYSRDTGYDVPRYPGSGSQGYTGASTGSYGQQPQYPPSGNPGYGYGQQPQQSPGTDPRFAPSGQPGSMMNQVYQGSQDSPYISTGSNMNVQRGYPNPNDPYGSARIPASSASMQQPTYSSAPPSQPGYPAASPSYSYNQAAPPTSSYSSAQPQDAFCGRGGQPSQAQPQGCVAANSQSSQMSSSRPATSSPHTAAASSATSGRHSNREADRHSVDRHVRPARR
jgi:hypothetical protein